MEPRASVSGEGGESVASAHVETNIEQSSEHPTVTTRKNSITGTLSKITDRAISFGHHRRLTGLATSSSSLSLTPSLANERYPSQLPTLIGGTTSNSRTFTPSMIQTQDENSNLAVANTFSKRPTRRISEKFSQLPFFHHDHSHREARVSTPSLPQRASSIKIEHRGLMAPIQPSSIPRSITLGNISENRHLPVSLNQANTSLSRTQALPASNPVKAVPFAPGPATRSNLRSPNSSSRRPYVKSPAPQVLTASSKSLLRVPGGLSGRSTLQSPISYYQAEHGSHVKSFDPPATHSLTKSSSHLLGKKGRTAVRSPGPNPTTIPPPSFSSTPRQSLPSQIRMLPRSAVIPPTTRLPTPTAELLTPDYENPDEEARDKRAQYVAPVSNSSSSSSSSNVVPRKISSFSTASDSSDLTPLIRTRSREPRPVTPPPAPSSPHPPPSPPGPPPPPPPTPEPNPNSHTTTPPRPAVRFSLPSHNLHPDNVQLVYEAQPARYWLARHETLSSFLRTAALNGDPFPYPFPPPPDRPLPSLPLLASLRARASRGRRDIPAPAFRGGNVTPPMTQAERDRIIFLQLRDRCVTEQATASLDAFIREWVRRGVVVEEAPVPAAVEGEEERKGFWGRRG